MDLNAFMLYRLPWRPGEILPDDCTKYAVEMGMVPNEKDDSSQFQ